MAKTGRNQLCPCGSGKKFKNCCGNGKLKVQTRQLNPQGFQRLFIKLVEDTGGFDITYKDLIKLSPDVALSVKHDRVKDSFRLEAVKIKQGKVLQPSKKLILPN